MAIELDHLILPVNDRAKSLEFYREILGLVREADDGPFSLLRVSPGCVLLLAQWGTKGGEHLAFSMSKSEFDGVFARVKARSIPYGDEFDKVGNMKGPGRERGARGMADTIYFFDPDKHLLEIRHYE
jgi:catechol 2,3-dioxygenase-like lactoylglutathione lyase family enzyme